jgi:2-iminobutanoate/2-iminopropanoate deaminase
MNRQVISTSKAPKAIGPYSQAIAAGDFVFCAGQVGLDPVTGELTQDLEQQVTRSLENLKAVLAEAGLSTADVVKTSVFLTSMDDFAAMNEIYGQVFAGDPPARNTVAVKELPKGALFEIDAIAVRGA